MNLKNWYYLREGKVIPNIGIVSFHPSKSKHWVKCLNVNYFEFP